MFQGWQLIHDRKCSLKDAVQTKKVTERQILDFRLSCANWLNLEDNCNEAAA